MSGHEAWENSNWFPPEEAAPTLHYPWEEDAPTPVHVSELTPDPEATVSLQAWARLYYQMFNLNPVEEIPTMAFTDNEILTVGYERSADSVTGLGLGLTSIIGGQNNISAGRAHTHISLDINRPGYVVATDTYISLPETMPETERIEPADSPSLREGIYIAGDKSVIAFKESTYRISEKAAGELTDTLRDASPISNQFVAGTVSLRFEIDSEKMAPGLLEACNKYFGRHEPLI